jgi:hypothetical protein
VLIEVQKLVVPKPVKRLLYLSDFSLLSIVIPIYKISRHLKIEAFLKNMLLPSNYKMEIKMLDRVIV